MEHLSLVPFRVLAFSGGDGRGAGGGGGGGYSFKHLVDEGRACPPF